MNIDQMTLASRLKDARTAASLTQEQVAKTLELPRTAIEAKLPIRRSAIAGDGTLEGSGEGFFAGRV